MLILTTINTTLFKAVLPSKCVSFLSKHSCALDLIARITLYIINILSDNPLSTDGNSSYHRNFFPVIKNLAQECMSNSCR